MKRVRALLAALVTACGLLSGAADVLAANAGKLETVSEETVIREGQEITLRFSLEGLSGTETGVHALKGTLEYDTEVFEPVSQEDFETVNSWEKLLYHPENGQFVLIHRAGSVQEEIFHLRLTVKAAVAEEEGKIAVRSLSASDGMEDLTPEDALLTLAVLPPETEGGAGQPPAEEDQGPEGEPSRPDGDGSGEHPEIPEQGEDSQEPEAPGQGDEGQEPEQGGDGQSPGTPEQGDEDQEPGMPGQGEGGQSPGTPEQGDEDQEPETPGQGEGGQSPETPDQSGQEGDGQAVLLVENYKDTDGSKEDRERAGVDTGDTADIAFYAAGILIGSLCLTGLAVFWRRRRKFSDGSKLLTGVIVFTAALLLTSGSVYGSSGKGDLNGDGGTDDADVELLEKHLIERELLPEDRRDAADLNGDGSLTVTDLALLVRRVEGEESSEAGGEMELKDVTAERLYYVSGTGGEEVRFLDISDGIPEDTDSYYAVIEMDSMQDLYAGIREFRRDPGSDIVSAVLDLEGLVRYRDNGARESEYSFPVAYRDDTGEHPLITSAEELFAAMASDPKGSFELTEDLDASGISADTAAVAVTFSGELDGNGYRIRNLPTTLFRTLSGANIHDLVIENADLTVAMGGILADVIQNRSVIENVFIVDSSIANGVDGMGAFAGRLVNSEIRKSASVDVSVKGLVAVGGIVGKTENGALIEDCSVTGKVQGTYDHPTLGARTGGITGWHGGGTIRRCFVRARILAPAKKGNGGLIGGPNTGEPLIEYSLSMSSGDGYRIAGFDVLEHAVEVYEYAGSDSSTNITKENGEHVKETDSVYDRNFYQEILGFDREIWNLDGLVYGKLPALKNFPGGENNYAIPNYSVMVNHTAYRPARERAYANIARLMPMADTAMWVEYGNQLSDGDVFATETIHRILPLDENNAFVAGVHRNAPETVRKIRITFENGTMQEYPVSYRETGAGLAASYEVEGTELLYQFRNYVSAIDEAFLSETAAIAAGYDYSSEIAGLTSEEESRLYTDYYNENVKDDLEQVLWNFFSSDEYYPAYSMHPAVRALAEERMQDEEKLKRMLYAYNYYDKWYRIDYNGVSLSDLLLFRGDLISEELSASVLTERLLSAGTGQRDTHQTANFYNSVMKQYTGQGLTEFLGGLSRSIAGYQDPNEWFEENFSGVLVEKGAYGDDEGAIRYRIWDNLSGLEEGRKSLVLQILTAPQEDMYLISVPSQLLIGSMNRYQEYLNKDGQERERIRRIAEEYAEKMGIFYGVSSQWMSNAVQQLNSFVNIQYDTRLGFPESAAAEAGIQEKGSTRDPVMKWVYEANNMLNALNGSAAVADGSIVIWMHTPALGTSDYIFFTFSHETAHNQDGRYFYGGAGRREGTGGEAHADGNIAQEMRDGIMVFNISKINEIGTEMTNNFSYERIDSAEKVHSYYREMFDAGYVLDYLAAQAFFQLTPEQQAAVAVQAEHTAGGNASMSTTYKKLTAEEIGAMNLKTMEDLWENRISIRNAGSYPEKIGTATEGSYGFESFYTMNWYQSHNDNGSPDTHSFKRLGQEMLGLAGYENGYVVYMSGLSKNDLEALRTITGDPNITWKEYKLGRYREVEQKLDRIPYFDKETVIGQFKAAFETDAENGNTSQSIETKRMIYGMVKRVTGDFSDGGIYQSPAVIPVSSAEDLIRLAQQNPFGSYRLEQDLDFSGITASGGSYIPGRFIGILDGNGHKITGMRYPLFGDLQYGFVKDLTISVSSYEEDAQALLAVKARKVILGNIRTDDPDGAQIPLVKTRLEGYYEYRDESVTVEEMSESSEVWPEDHDGIDENTDSPGSQEENGEIPEQPAEQEDPDGEPAPPGEDGDAELNVSNGEDANDVSTVPDRENGDVSAVPDNRNGDTAPDVLEDAGNSSAESAHLLHSLYANTGIESIQTITERFSMTGCRSSSAAELLHNLKI